MADAVYSELTWSEVEFQAYQTNGENTNIFRQSSRSETPCVCPLRLSQARSSHRMFETRANRSVALSGSLPRDLTTVARDAKSILLWVFDVCTTGGKLPKLERDSMPDFSTKPGLCVFDMGSEAESNMVLIPTKFLALSPSGSNKVQLTLKEDRVAIRARKFTKEIVSKEVNVAKLKKKLEDEKISRQQTSFKDTESASAVDEARATGATLTAHLEQLSVQSTEVERALHKARATAATLKAQCKQISLQDTEYFNALNEVDATVAAFEARQQQSRYMNDTSAEIRSKNETLSGTPAVRGTRDPATPPPQAGSAHRSVDAKGRRVVRVVKARGVVIFERTTSLTGSDERD